MKNIIHWNTQKKIWTSHTYKGCEWAATILINGPWKAECKPEKESNPRGWIVSTKEDVTLNPSEDILRGFIKRERLVYQKEQVEFNINEGQALLFDEDGCHLLDLDCPGYDGFGCICGTCYADEEEEEE